MNKINKEKIKLPKIGARTVKSGITVFLCSLISMLVLKRDSVHISIISGMTCIQNSLENSVNNGKNRIIGTIVGAVVGFIGLSIASLLKTNNFIVISLIAGFGTMATIYICVLFSITESINTAYVMFIILMMNIGQDNWLNYSIMRTIDTFVGVIVGINVNRFILKDSFKKVKKK